ncbi:MAG: right-handed parallel beta-helix repeat-containing protein, partial [archaeon]|nr:right-handed parallel beta-helix repeat-containing protein [archaeon]
MKKEVNIVLLVLGLFLVFSLYFISAAFVDDSTPSQILHDCGTLNTSNAVYTMNQSIYTTGTCFNITADNVTVDGNGFSIDGDSPGTDYGIYSKNKLNLTIKNFENITHFDEGIYLINVNNSLIQNNNVSLSGDSGIFLSSSSHNRLISNNLSKGYFGIQISASSFNIFGNMTLNSNSWGIHQLNSPNRNNNFSNLEVKFNSNTGISTTESNYSNFINITLVGNSQYGLYIINVAGMTIINSQFYGNGLYQIYSHQLDNNTLIYNNSFGEIKWAQNKLTTKGDLTFPGNITIENNSAYFNPQGNENYLNFSANVTLRGIGDKGFISPRILKDGAVCVDCWNFTSLTASTIVFNVSSFSNYTIGEEPDNYYPQFSNYGDNNATLTSSGVGLFNVTVENTNGTVILEINGLNITAENLTSNVYNISYNFASAGTYSYRWLAYGNGTFNQFNSSETRYYLINAAAEATPAPAGGGGGGGSSSSSSKEWTLTKIISDEQLNSENNFLLAPKQKAEFDLFGYVKSYFGIKSITDGVIIAQTSINSENTTAKVGDILKFDYNNDSFYDLEIMLNSITSG